MNCLTEKINMLLRPEAALIVYHCEEPEKMFYLETRPITPDGKMGAAQPVSCEFMNRLTSAYCESHSGTPFGPIPETMLYCDVRKGREKYIWYNPPAKRMMYFRKDLCMENAEYHMPGACSCLLPYVVEERNAANFCLQRQASCQKCRIVSCAVFQYLVERCLPRYGATE